MEHYTLSASGHGCMLMQNNYKSPISPLSAPSLLVFQCHRIGLIWWIIFIGFCWLKMVLRGALSDPGAGWGREMTSSSNSVRGWFQLCKRALFLDWSYVGIRVLWAIFNHINRLISRSLHLGVFMYLKIFLFFFFSSHLCLWICLSRIPCVSLPGKGAVEWVSGAVRLV